MARVFDDLDCYPLQQPGAQDRQTLSFEQFRINSYPSMAIDRSNGHIAIVWADNQGSGNCGTGGSSFIGTTSNQVKLVTSVERHQLVGPPDDHACRLGRQGVSRPSAQTPAA